MKTSNKINWLLTVIAVLFLLSCGAAGVIKNGVFFGKRYFDISVVIYASGILLGVLYLLLFLLLFRKYQLKTHCVFSLITVVMMLPFLVFTSVKYFQDVWQGCTELKTEIYKIPVGGWRIEPSGKPVEIQPSCPGYGFLHLPVSEEIYNDLTQNNPQDRTRTVFDEAFGEYVYPHLHPIIIRFYAHTGVVESIQIDYTQ